MADVVRTLTSHLRTVGVTVAVVALFGGTATTISLADSSKPSPKPAKVKPAKAKQHVTPKPASPAVRPTDTHGYCVSHAVAAAKAKGATGQAIAAAAHSCAPKAHKAKTSHGKGSGKPERDAD